MSTKSTLEGKILIAMPNLLDPNFYRTVVLIVEHDDEGALGLVLNRVSALTTQELCINQGVIWRGRNEQVRVGGPVQPTSLWILHRMEREGEDSTPISADCYLTTSLEGLGDVAEAEGEGRRIFAGYSGWGDAQLDDEVREGIWLVADPDGTLIFEAGAGSLWEEALRKVGVDPGMLVVGPNTTLQ